MTRRALLSAILLATFASACGGAAVDGSGDGCPGGTSFDGQACMARQPAAVASPQTTAALQKLRDAPSEPADVIAEYRSARRLEKANDFASARRLYTALATKCGDEDADPALIALTPYVDFAAAEMFFVESRPFGSYYVNAREEYARVLESPPQKNPLYPFAMLRIAEIDDLMGSHANAREAYRDLAQRFAKSDAVAEIPKWAR
jgi:TolA-binding protein